MEWKRSEILVDKCGLIERLLSEVANIEEKCIICRGVMGWKLGTRCTYRVNKGLRALCDHRCGHRTWLLLIERVRVKSKSNRNPSFGSHLSFYCSPSVLGPQVLATPGCAQTVKLPPEPQPPVPRTISLNFVCGEHARLAWTVDVEPATSTTSNNKFQWTQCQQHRHECAKIPLRTSAEALARPFRRRLDG